jgi:hypothetical protein
MQPAPHNGLWVLILSLLKLVLMIVILPIMMFLHVIAAIIGGIGITLTETAKILFVPINDIGVAIFMSNTSGSTQEDKQNNED